MAALRGLKETLQAFMRHLRKTTHLGASFTILGEFVFPLALEVIYTGVCVCVGGVEGLGNVCPVRSNIEVIQMKTRQTIMNYAPQLSRKEVFDILNKLTGQ